MPAGVSVCVCVFVWDWDWEEAAREGVWGQGKQCNADGTLHIGRQLVRGSPQLALS